MRSFSAVRRGNSECNSEWGGSCNLSDIELDGAVHEDSLRKDYDEKRTEYLEGQGIRVIRIENRLLFESRDDMLDYIASFFGKQ